MLRQHIDASCDAILFICFFIFVACALCFSFIWFPPSEQRGEMGEVGRAARLSLFVIFSLSSRLRAGYWPPCKVVFQIGKQYTEYEKATRTTTSKRRDCEPQIMTK